MRMFEVTLGVPKLGIIKEVYDFDEPSSKETLDKNVEQGCMILNIKQLGNSNAQEGKIKMENLNNTNEVAPPVPPTLTSISELMDELNGTVVTSDEAEPTDAERTLH